MAGEKRLWRSRPRRGPSSRRRDKGRRSESAEAGGGEPDDGGFEAADEVGEGAGNADDARLFADGDAALEGLELVDDAGEVVEDGGFGGGAGRRRRDRRESERGEVAAPGAQGLREVRAAPGLESGGERCQALRREPLRRERSGNPARQGVPQENAVGERLLLPLESEKGVALHVKGGPRPGGLHQEHHERQLLILLLFQRTRRHHLLLREAAPLREGAGVAPGVAPGHQESEGRCASALADGRAELREERRREPRRHLPPREGPAQRTASHESGLV
mmetsp:Transcript_30632/g.93625  ORF Transcript_30632/g.93625 Transcript_30632/m.93625 type:complete len:277 (-) Transcript_30632:1060-1890(-)